MNDMITVESFNDFLLENNIDINHVVFEDDIFTKIIEVLSYQNQRIVELEDKHYHVRGSL